MFLFPTHTSLHRVTGGEVATFSAAKVVDLLGEDLALPLLAHVAHVEVTRIHDVRHHHPLGH